MKRDITAASVAAGTSGDAGQPAMPSGGDEHSVRAAPSHEYVAARRGCICRSWLNLRMVHTE